MRRSKKSEKTKIMVVFEGETIIDIAKRSGGSCHIYVPVGWLGEEVAAVKLSKRDRNMEGVSIK